MTPLNFKKISSHVIDAAFGGNEVVWLQYYFFISQTGVNCMLVGDYFQLRI